MMRWVWTAALCVISGSTITLAAGESEDGRARQEEEDTNRGQWEAMRYLIPREWGEERREISAGRMEIKKHHRTDFMGNGLAHLKLEIEERELRGILKAHEIARMGFQPSMSERAIEHSFGERSGRSLDMRGKAVELEWWRPHEAKAEGHYAWIDDEARPGPRVAVRMRVSDGGEGRKLVYVKIEDIARLSGPVEEAEPRVN